MKHRTVGVGIFGLNGHQIHNKIAACPEARLVAVAGISGAFLPSCCTADNITKYNNFDNLLSDPRVEFISLCSPNRSQQANQAIRALHAGKHVYAEKPCALNEADLDAIVRTARETGLHFHEMADTAFLHPYLAMREIVLAGKIGDVVQVIAEKSYPYHEARPQDEALDGGLIRQCGVHALRFVEHVAGCRIHSISAVETCLGNPVESGGLRMAASLMLRLSNGGVASVSANYLNPKGTAVWGYETLRIYGTRGMVESSRGGAITRLVIGEKDCGALTPSRPDIDYFRLFLQTILGEASMPLPLEDELSPTRWAIRAKSAAGRFI